MKVPLYQNNRKKGLPGVHSVITQSFPKGAFYVNLGRMYCSGSPFPCFHFEGKSMKMSAFMKMSGYPNFLGVFARNLGVNFGGEKK